MFLIIRIVSLTIRDIEHTSVPIYSVKAHNEIVMSIDGIAGTSVGCGAPEIVTGSRDSKFHITTSG